ncbi:MAG: hypothetical protein A3E84_03320 [Gammaproteobacteria bacterium RIFCSPHIGHO2_12_FULL_42_13]|nr:MAG: hypothetical protein A3E84_03320 [Gammaproteobacteria bacterium RIFCSPHIGHO2_12_FULL_42_13]
MFVLAVFVILALNILVFTQNNQKNQSAFNAALAANSLEDIQKQLNRTADYTVMLKWISAIGALRDQAKQCVTTSEGHLKIINDLLKTSGGDESQLQRADLQYLKEKQHFYTEQLSNCQLFIYRAYDVLSQYQNVIQVVSAYEILKRETPLWRVFHEDWHTFFSSVQFKKVLADGGIFSLSIAEGVSGVVLLLVAILTAVYVRYFLQHVIGVLRENYLVWVDFFTVLSAFVVPCTVLAFLSVYLNIIAEVPSSSLVLISHALLITALAVMLTKYLFYPNPDSKSLLGLSPEVGRLFYHRFSYLVGALFLGYAATTWFRGQLVPDGAMDLTRTIYVTVTAWVTASIFLLLRRLPVEDPTRRNTITSISSAMIAVLIALVFSEWFGYHSLAIFAVKGLCFSIAATVIMVALWRLVDRLYQWMENNTYLSSKKVHQWLGVKPTKHMPEFILLRTVAYFSVGCFYLIALVRSWSTSSALSEALMGYLWEGFKLAGLTIVPSRLAFAVILFSAIFMLGRILAASIARRQNTGHDEDTQIALATITIYISFAIAFLFAMLVTGINFTGLAIIAGALSVGVGLGLQNIVNNFFSGLILLIEKPIKPGDRIVVGDTEGFVRKIRIRSTQIATLLKEDVIIPNADLISQKVVNHMFRDRTYRIVCSVSVAYGTDVQLIKKLLLEVAAQHDEVVHNTIDAPIVLFRGFGDNALLFELWCVLYDVNKKLIVCSDLYFSIDEIFRANNITIPFPQRDIHIKHDAASTLA